MPDLVRLLPKLDSMDLPPPQRIEKTQLDLLCALGEYREVYSFSVPGCSERIWFAGPDNPIIWLVQSNALKKYVVINYDFSTSENKRSRKNLSDTFEALTIH